MTPSKHLPNQITAARGLLAVVFFVLLARYEHRTPTVWLLDAAWILFVVAAVSDFLDGYIARRYGFVTALGRILDPLVDKVLICGTFIFFAGENFVGESGENATRVAAWMVVVIVCRELLVTGLRGFSESKGHAFGAGLHGKLKMWMQSIAAPTILFIIARQHTGAIGDVGDTIKLVLAWATTLITALSTVQYLMRARHVLAEDES